MVRKKSPRQDYVLSLLLCFLSLPVIISLLELKNEAPDGVPSSLTLALLFVYLILLPTLSWVMVFSRERGFATTEQLMQARFGTNRNRLVIRRLLRQATPLLASAFLMSGVALSLNYGTFNLSWLKEMLLLTPVSLVWTALLLSLLHALRSWGRKLSMVVLALIYPLLLTHGLPLGPVSNLGGTWMAARPSLWLSPIFHLGHLLGAFVQSAPLPGSLSLLLLGVFASFGLALVLLRVPS